MKHLVIVCVDDHPMFLQGLVEVIKCIDAVKEVHAFSNCAAAIAEVPNIMPHLMFVDLKLKDGDGFELCKQVKLISPNTYLIALTAYDEHMAPSAFAHGADAYFSKTTDTHIIEQFVENFDVQAEPRKQVYTSSHNDYNKRNAQQLIDKLTPREKELMQLEAKGLKRAEIMKTLSISVHTYKSHVTNIKAKLNLSNVTSLISFASRYFSIK